MRRFYSGAIALTFLLFAPSAGAQYREETKVDKKASMWIGDQIHASLADVKIGEIANERATRQDVKEFAKMLVDEHQKVHDQLRDLARDKKVEVREELSGDHKKQVDKLGKMPAGMDFDREFINMVVQGHEKAVKEYQRAVETIKDAEVKSFAQRTLPTLRQHHERAKELQKELKERPGAMR